MNPGTKVESGLSLVVGAAAGQTVWKILRNTHYDVFRDDLWAAILDYDHRPTNSPTVTCNVDGSMVVVNVDANKFTEFSRPA